MRHSSLMRSRALTAALGLTLVSGCNTPVEQSVASNGGTRPTSIIGGVVAGNAFSNVGGLVVRTSETQPWRPYCSGTLIAPDVFLTTGHCAFFASALFGELVQLGIHFDPVLTIGTEVITAGTWIVHPQFDPRTFVLPTPALHPDTHDLSIFVMNRPVAGIRAARLPERGSLARSIEDDEDEPITITTVGYGVQAKGEAVTNQVTGGTRKAATGTLAVVDDAWLQISPDTGIMCGGDSGGANVIGSSGLAAKRRFVERVIATSTNANCNRAANFAMLYRLDTDSALGFLGKYVEGHGEED